MDITRVYETRVPGSNPGGVGGEGSKGARERGSEGAREQGSKGARDGGLVWFVANALWDYM